MSLAEPFLQEASTTHCGWVCAAQLDSHRFNSQFTSMREAARPEYLKPDSFDLSNYVQGYDSKKHFMERPSLAISLVHIQEDEPENAYRDADEGLRQSIQARMQAVQARMAPAPAAPAPPAP